MRGTHSVRTVTNTTSLPGGDALIIVRVVTSRLWQPLLLSIQYLMRPRAYFTVRRTIERGLWLFFVSGDSTQQGCINYTRFYVTPPVVRLTKRHRNTAQLFPLTSSPSMDVFTYIVDIFASTSDDEDLPTNEENPSSGPGNPPLCVIAWDASFPIAYLMTATPFYCTSSFMLGSKCFVDVLGFSETSSMTPA